MIERYFEFKHLKLWWWNCYFIKNTKKNIRFYFDINFDGIFSKYSEEFFPFVLFHDIESKLANSSKIFDLGQQWSERVSAAKHFVFVAMNRCVQIRWQTSIFDIVAPDELVLRQSHWSNIVVNLRLCICWSWAKCERSRDLFEQLLIEWHKLVWNCVKNFTVRCICAHAGVHFRSCDTIVEVFE